MNISIIDDHFLMSESVKRLLQEANSDDEIKTFQDPIAFLAYDFKTWEPDIVITDLLMPNMDGLEMIGKLKEILTKDTKFILFTSLHDIQTLQTALRRGVCAYLTKDASPEEVLEAVEAAKEGKKYMNKSIQDKLLSHMFLNEEEIVYHISPQEKEVLKRICDGSTPKEIAYNMKLSINTIQSYIKNLLRKFKVNRTADLIVFATKNGLV